MASRIYNLTIDARNPSDLARFWGRVLDYDVAYERPDEVGFEPRGRDDLPAPNVVPREPIAQQ